MVESHHVTTKLKSWTGRALLAFVLVTIGFALGRQTAPTDSSGLHGGGAPPPPRLPQADTAEGATASSESQPATQSAQREPLVQVVVYSTHMTFRCWECNRIEYLTGELMKKEFAEERSTGLIEYRSVDYLKDAAFARRYDIATSTVVLVRFEDGQECGFERLDEVWTRSRNRGEFFDYVGSAIRAQLRPKPPEAAE